MDYLDNHIKEIHDAINVINGKKFYIGSINLFDYNLTSLEPLGLSNVSVFGNFHCNNNLLTNLIGSPNYVAGHMDCSNNLLIELTGSPKTVYSFNCRFNNLKSLIGAPEEVLMPDTVHGNPLYSMVFDGDGRFDCTFNDLISLEGVPKIIDGVFIVDKSILKKLYTTEESIQVLDLMGKILAQ